MAAGECAAQLQAADPVEQRPVNRQRSEPVEGFQGGRDGFSPGFLFCDPAADPLGEAEHFPLDHPRVGHLHHDPGSEVLPEPGGGDEQGRPDFTEILRDGLRGFGKVHRHSADQGDPDTPHLVHDPGGRRHGDPVFALLNGHGLDPARGDGRQVPVRQHGELRQPGRSGGEDHESGVAPAALPNLLRDAIRVFPFERLPHSDQLAESDQPGLAPVGPHSGGVDVDHAADMREPVAGVQELVDLFLVLDEDKGRLNPVEGQAQLVSDRGGEQIQRHGAQRLGPQFTEEPLRMVVQDEADMFAALQPE